MDTLVEDRPSPEAQLAAREDYGAKDNLLQRAISDLPERERAIFMERRLSEEPKTLEELGTVYGVSRERVRQLEVRAFEKVKKAVLNSAGENAPDLLAAMA